MNNKRGKVTLSKSVGKKPYKVQVWNESLMIGEYDTRTVKGRKDMSHDISLIKKVLKYELFKVVMQKQVVTRVW
jgi:hypothetical protein